MSQGPHKIERNLQTFVQDAVPAQIGGSYRWFTGSFAYVLHRVTGLGLLVYIFLHILSVRKASFADPYAYDLLMYRYQAPDFKIGELLLYGALLFHGINGIRILLVDFVFERSAISKKLFWYAFWLILALFIIGCIPLLMAWNTFPLKSGALPGGH